MVHTIVNCLMAGGVLGILGAVRLTAIMVTLVVVTISMTGLCG